MKFSPRFRTKVFPLLLWSVLVFAASAGASAQTVPTNATEWRTTGELPQYPPYAIGPAPASSSVPYFDNAPARERPSIPDFSVRLDPRAWLTEEQLKIELEVELLSWLTLELVPTFITNEQQAALGRELPLERQSNFLGPIPGAGLNLGFWLGDDALHGSVIRAGLRIDSFTYRTFAEENRSEGVRRGDVVDEVNYIRDLLTLEWGYHHNWGPFTVSGGLGLAYEMFSPKRCLAGGRASVPATSSDCDETQLVLVAQAARGAAMPAFHDLYSPTVLALHPFSLTARLSFGILIE